MNLRLLYVPLEGKYFLTSSINILNYLQWGYLDLLIDLLKSINVGVCLLMID